MTLDPLLAKAHFYDSYRKSNPQNKVYLNLEGPANQPWVAIKSNIVLRNGAALVTLKKMVKMLPALSDAFRNLKEMQNQCERVEELASTIMYIVEGVQTKINTQQCKLCSYVYLIRVERRQNQLMETLVQLPLTHYEKLLEELLPIQRIPSRAEELISEIEQLTPPMPIGLQTPQNTEAFAKEKRTLISKIKLLMMLWELDSIIESSDDWTSELRKQREIQTSVDVLNRRRFEIVKRDPSLLLTSLMLQYHGKTFQIGFIMENSNIKHGIRSVVSAPERLYSSIKLMFA